MSVNEHNPPWPGMGVAIEAGDRNCEYTVNGVTAHPGYLEREPVPGHCAGQQLGYPAHAPHPAVTLPQQGAPSIVVWTENNWSSGLMTLSGGHIDSPVS